MTRFLDTHDMIVIVDFGKVSTKGIDSLRKIYEAIQQSN